MPSVAAVRLTYNPKVLWFDPKGVEFAKGDALIVKTERGLEYGIADENVKEVDATAVSKLKTALKPVVRKATEEDERSWRETQAAAAEALPVFKELVAEQGLDMHPVAVEFLFDGDKAIFYFEAEDRVDFRELVRSLASRFRMRIDMRQIGVRDEARIVGGFGHCGQELCCKRLGGEFNPVSIRMAKDQDLSLNPQKISGVCGRLMCCLRYEADVYKEFKTRCPKMGAAISTPKGSAKVVEVNVPRETVTLSVADKRVKIPVSEMGIDPKTGKPGSVSEEVFDEYANQNLNGAAASIDALVTTPMFTGTDKLASNPTARRTGGSSSRSRAQQQKGRGKGESSAEEASKRTSRRRRRSRSTDAGSQQPQSASAPKKGAQKPQQSPSSKKQAASSGKPSEQRRKSGARPGQRSSGLAAVQQPKKAVPQQGASAPSGEHRRSRRRSHKAQGGDARQE